MGRVEGKVAFITGAARGQGRSHAVTLANEGADIIAVDLLQPDAFPWMAYPQAESAQLDETVALVEKTGRRIVARQADVRDRDSLRAALDAGLAEFGHVDIVSANAGISPFGPESWKISPQQWTDVLAVNLTGVWNTTSVCLPPMIEAGRGGSIILTSSGAGTKGVPNLSDYCASKFGVIGLMKSLANEVGRHNIRVNALTPGTVATDMVLNEGLYRLFRPDLENPTKEDAAQMFATMINVLPESWAEPVDISHALLFLASDEARFVTGQVLGIDLGSNIR
ncbi:putative short-chain type dehydrogenase/reductase MSMEG_6031/MSMEI_5872 [Frankia canadensis]|uniref:Putative short-chain type dehydrogenase/reductase MSMEG_6031/MSMEI_5872 n=1 Tax=Frankia canadensis TaxID=1836972 RepID=A0A2I2KW77_9ACTN|nr:mycofactocin-coupled SDR family oxidoreductase [Frankia canadensis]SNQ49912.1 putative short-chain type dehydrogenase/reductase MSMEG_6031/MSMEI_5872 [Frankia canadensis]SOU57202.1 putative short-chain type dehydrogenase/reductase MSMEG_6031/MSMEI_5872 [Frankia canadensis]